MNEQIKQAIESANGSCRARRVGINEACELTLLMKQNQNNKDVHTIRVYSREGFVPNSYKYRCEISVLEARRDENGEFQVYGFSVDAKRSHGRGALVTINGRSR